MQMVMTMITPPPPYPLDNNMDSSQCWKAATYEAVVKSSFDWIYITL